MKTHLATEPFEAIKNGNKTIESRLYDSKRQQLQLGEVITFIHRENEAETMTAKVIGLLRYGSFEAMFAHNNPAKFGGSSIDELLDQVRQFYPAEQEHEYGVVGIEFELV
jgi:ASC-1-like (ASCH) protein